MSLLEQPAQDEGYELVPLSEVEQREAEQNALENVIATLGADSVTDILLKVYRLNDITNKEEWCFDCDPEALPLENRLLSVYGGGEFAIRVMTPTPEGRKSLKRKVKISIAKPKEPEKEPEKDNSGEDIKNVIATMMESQQRQSENMMQMFREAQLESQNKTQEMMITILGNKNDGEKQPTLLETMSLLKTLQPEAKDPLETLTAMMNLQNTMKEMVTPEEPSALGELSKAATSLVSMAANAPARTAQPAPAQPGQKPDTTAPPAPAAIEQQSTETGNDMNPLIKMKLKPQLLFLLDKARQGKNVAVYADLMIEEIPEQFYPQLINALGANDDEALATLASIEPAIMEQAEWFKAFCGEIRAAFDEAAGELDPDNTGEGLTTGNASGDDSENHEEITDANTDKQPATVENESNA